MRDPEWREKISEYRDLLDRAKNKLDKILTKDSVAQINASSESPKKIIKEVDPVDSQLVQGCKFGFHFFLEVLLG